MEKCWKNHLLTLTKELGEELAKDFVSSMYCKSKGSVNMASQFFYELGETWAPVMYHWAQWIKENSENQIALILRDAKPLEAISMTKEWKKLYLNRQNCGIKDELSGDVSKPHPLLKKYLEQNFCSEYFTFVDSGCYGTIVLQLYQMGIRFKPLFFFSKNQNIPGFLNNLGFTESEGEVLNDSLECAFPNIYERPSNFVEIGENVNVSLKQSDYLSVLFGKSAFNGLSNFNFSNCAEPRFEVIKLLKLSEEAKKGNFTGILGHSSPEWSKKNEFLANWPKNLLWI